MQNSNWPATEGFTGLQRPKFAMRYVLVFSGRHRELLDSLSLPRAFRFYRGTSVPFDTQPFPLGLLPLALPHACQAAC